MALSKPRLSFSENSNDQNFISRDLCVNDSITKPDLIRSDISVVGSKTALCHHVDSAPGVIFPLGA